MIFTDMLFTGITKPQASMYILPWGLVIPLNNMSVNVIFKSLPSKHLKNPISEYVIVPGIHYYVGYCKTSTQVLLLLGDF